jgi:ammonium transporter, Amt family
LRDQVELLSCALAHSENGEMAKLTRQGRRGLDAVALPLIDSGDTAWMLTSTALVLFMTLPGLALYYSGMVRVKNVLATVMQTLSIAALITILWLCWGYSLAFAPTQPCIDVRTPSSSNCAASALIYGDGSRLWLQGLTVTSTNQLAPTIPESVFCTYQLTFAIITAALICGSFADRMKFVPMLVFISVWHTIVYCPIAHSVWHPQGFLFKAGVLDYAGGNVVHISSGMAGLASTIVIGNRRGFGIERFAPHNILTTFTGMSMLWVGWFGFNAGSALAANGRAGYAMLVTQVATATAAYSWLLTEWCIRKQPSLLGMVSGAITGLVAITPASGFVDVTGAFVIGLSCGLLTYWGAQLKHLCGYDDALDAFGVHAIAGALGGILTGFFAIASVGGSDGVFYGSLEVGGHQLGVQLYAILVCGGWSFFASLAIFYVVDVTMGLRVSKEHEGMPFPPLSH